MTQLTLRKISKPNCRPCAVLTNYLESIAVDLLALDVNVAEHDIADDPALVERYNLSSVPVLVLERNGYEVGRLNGLVSTTEILDAVKAAKEDV
ncbi:thioredoxin family protein [uncultured Planococcus sp.]|uniref:thioredoxin family protein n=1 Tax=uncultured Planococcus sp. TaxID=337815 RepID=UPI002619B583|nr:thioredoxin family protein [uncultured Planococcus sp.]